MLFGALKAALGLGFVIFVHELGHFLVAKSCGVKCEKFYIGFDVPMKLGFGKWGIPLPSSFWKKQWGETLYGIGVIPLGGYVKMLGQDDNPAKYREMQEKAKLAQEEQDAGSGATGGGATETPVTDANSGGEEDYVLDPRSYMAKSVPKRMAIISAGVIMNLIFAVNFAALAYYLGAPFTPTVIGSTSPGSPAWAADLPLGGKIIQITKAGRKSENLRFGMDFTQTVALWDKNTEISLLIRHPDGEEKVSTITPAIIEIEGEGKISQIGIGGPSTTQLAAKDFIPEHIPLPTSKASPAFEGSDKIVAIKVDGQQFDTLDFPAYSAQLARHADKEIVFVVEREVKREGGSASDKNKAPETETLDIKVGRRPRRMAGFGITLGPVTAIRQGSPAEKAGLFKDDVIKKVNGKDVVDPLTLPDVLRRLAGKNVTLTVERGPEDKRESVKLIITPEPPNAFSRGPGRYDPPLGIEAIGAAMAIEDIVSSTSKGSIAAEMLKPGDAIIAAVFVSDTEEGTQLLEEKGYPENIDLTKKFHNWLKVDSLLQQSPAGTKLKLTCLRDEKEFTVQLLPSVSDKWFLAPRGVMVKPAKETRTASGIGEAYSLGLRQTKEDALRVFTFLRKLVTGRVSPKMLGGPLTIGIVATSEASRDFTRLLLFLTLLSANLAVINFMPIPVLDGGHMVFLVLEAIFRRPVSEKIVIPLTYLGLFMILGLMLFVFGRDIDRFFVR